MLLNQMQVQMQMRMNQMQVQMHPSQGNQMQVQILQMLHLHLQIQMHLSTSIRIKHESGCIRSTQTIMLPDVSGMRNFFPINAPGMGSFQLLNLGGFGLWVRVGVLGSDCNNRFPNTNHNLNHNSNDYLTLTPKSNPEFTLTLTLY